MIVRLVAPHLVSAHLRSVEHDATGARHGWREPVLVLAARLTRSDGSRQN